MIETLSKKALISINNIWFVDSEFNVKQAKGQILFLHGVRNGVQLVGKAARETEQRTLITDLSKDETLLWQEISKTYRNEIRRCEKENRKYVYLTSKEILNNPDLIDAFERTYNEMFAVKGIKNKFNKKLFYAYAQNNVLITSIAYRSDNEPVVFHSYIMEKKNVRFWYSCSNFREDKKIAEEIGRLNKFLHWKDMIKMKKCGVENYDWGGISISEQMKGITEFKRKFGGTELTYRNYIYVKNQFLRTIFNIFFNSKKK